VFPTPEDGPFPVQTSLYGASKVAAEGFATAFATGFGLGVSVCRLVSVLGERYSHGHVVDFVTSLMGDPRHLTVLGDGYQTKAYVHVDDCVAGLLAATGESFGTIGIYNVAGEGTMTVRESLSWTCEELGVDPEVRFTGGERGWIGDSPRIEVSTARLRKTGWAPTVPLREAVVRTVRDVRRHLCLAAGSVRPGGGLDGGGPA
jgi:UDP-glucose 4-epimerase